MKLAKDERNFLERLMTGQPLKTADRAEDKVRQRMRRLGLAEVVTKPRRWQITDAGRAAMQEQADG